MAEPDVPLPWEPDESDSTLARATRAAFERVDVYDDGSVGSFLSLDADEPERSRLARQHVLGGFTYDVEELHRIAHAAGQAYAYQLAQGLAENIVGRGSERYEEVLDNLLAGLDRAGATGLFKGIFQMGVVIGELEAALARRLDGQSS